MDINEIIRQVTEEICSKYGANVSAPAAAGNNAADMAKYIDHTYLKPEASEDILSRIIGLEDSISASLKSLFGEE